MIFIFVVKIFRNKSFYIIYAITGMKTKCTKRV